MIGNLWVSQTMNIRKGRLKGQKSQLGTEKDLERERIHLDQLFENAQVGIVMAANDGTVTRVNPEFRRIFGYSAEECLGMNIDSLVTARQNRTEAEEITHSVAHGEKKAFEALRRCKDGTLKNVLVMASPIIVNGEQVAVYAFYRDITDQRRIEAELLKARQLETTGKLAGGIAHDFNNLLSIIMGNIELASINMPSDSPAMEALKNASDACKKANALTLKFLTFSAGGQPIKRIIDTAKVLREVAENVFADHPKLCSFAIPDDVWDIEVDPDLFRHVLAAVLENALEAVKGKGSVMIRAANLSEETCGTDIFLQDERRYLLIAVRDNGNGIPAESVPAVFDPYFSTKTSVSSKGLGMGLTLAHSIVTRHGGKIRLDSEHQKGTTVKIFIPA